MAFLRRRGYWILGTVWVLAMVAAIGSNLRLGAFGDRSSFAGLVVVDDWAAAERMDEPSVGTRPPDPENQAPTHGTTPFPRWGDPGGISWASIEAYIEHADANLASGRDLLRCQNGACPTDSPNVLYLFGASEEACRDCNSTGARPKVWVEGRRRKKVGVGFAKRYPIVEELLDRALQHLWDSIRSTNPGSQAATNPYPRLTRLLHARGPGEPLPEGASKRNETTGAAPSFASLGVPLILNLGDNRQCHSENLPREGGAHSVPVFTLAVPAGCHHAFPVPHPAALDTAKAYGHRWPRVLEHRRAAHPPQKQARKAVWRGSPTGIFPKQLYKKLRRAQREKKQKHESSLGNESTSTPEGSARYHLVVAANTLPSKDNNGSIQVWEALTALYPKETELYREMNRTELPKLVFDVGFGKRLDKIVPNLVGLAKEDGLDLSSIKGKPRLPFEDFAEYGVVLDADGSSWSERFGPLLCLNTVVAKTEPEFVDWLWPGVKPGVHYLAVDKDSSDLWPVVLDELVRQKRANDTHASRQKMEQKGSDDRSSPSTPMVGRANQWCSERMTYPRMVSDLLRTLEQYVLWLDQGDPDWTRKWERFFRENMPSQHHHWQAIPFQKPKPYFPILSEEILSKT